MKEAVFIICLIAISVSRAYACQPEVPNHSKYFRKAKAVFIGKVADVSLNDNQDADPKFNLYKIKFLVEKSWKGNESQVTITSDNGSGPCDQFQFDIGKKYLVYAFGKELYVTTYVGNRSRPLDWKIDDIRKKEFAELNSFWFRLKANLWIF